MAPARPSHYLAPSLQGAQASLWTPLHEKPTPPVPKCELPVAQHKWRVRLGGGGGVARIVPHSTYQQHAPQVHGGNNTLCMCALSVGHAAALPATLPVGTQPAGRRPRLQPRLQLPPADCLGRRRRSSLPKTEPPPRPTSSPSRAARNANNRAMLSIYTPCASGSRGSL